ncbi:hypothetical protein [Halohasta salina]|uniref:hypothetical protein n=1 Tax=Halohasta salina TaxID=2961621 RepID=UPI0020A42DF9|nr:hypothetical protein [Halohasta salina]
MTVGRRSRSRSRNGGHSRALVLLVGLAVGLLVAGFVVAPSTAFTTGSVDRGTAAPVVNDSEGILGIDVTDGLQAGTEGRLVTVTNNLNRSLSVDVSASASLSNSQATLAPGDSVTTAATVSCESPSSNLEMTITASANGQFSGLATRYTPVDTTDCVDPTLAFGTVEIVDQTTSAQGGKAEYAVSYSIQNDTGSFDRVSVDFENLDKNDGVATVSSSAQSDTISFTSGGQRFGERFEITVRLFDDTGEVQSERIVITDTADGSGTIYQSP